MFDLNIFVISWVDGGLEWYQAKVLEFLESWGTNLEESKMLKGNLKGLSDYVMYYFMNVLDNFAC